MLSSDAVPLYHDIPLLPGCQKQIVELPSILGIKYTISLLKYKLMIFRNCVTGSSICCNLHLLLLGSSRVS